MSFDPNLDLMLEKTLDLPVEKVWQAYTTPALLMEWFCPRPWKVIDCRMDLKPGGEFFSHMQGPDGENMPMTGCFLVVEKNKTLVWTDTLLPGFRPATQSFMTAIITFESDGNKTKYKAIAKHKNTADRDQHAQMGFEQGWSTTLDQMVELMKNR